MTEKINTKHIRDLLSRKSLCLESGEQMTIWLEKALDEIESLRSQLQQAEQEKEHQRQLFLMKSEECQNQRDFSDSWKRKFQQAEQERDDTKEYFRIKQDQVWTLDKERTYLREANTAMRAELEWYGESETWEKHYGNIASVDFDRGTKARDVLSRYPKEEE